MGGRACGPPPAQVDILTAPDFREWLKIAREAARVTQVELAKKVGVHPMTLSKIERGIYSCPQPLQLALRYLLELPR
jgi:transcriptional regulator with XRE-family HTH domain